MNKAQIHADFKIENILKFAYLLPTYRRYPTSEREAEIMTDELNNHDGKTSICDVIEEQIKELKLCKKQEQKDKQYFLIADSFGQYFKQTKTATIKRKFIKTFFLKDFFPLSTEQRHIKAIIDTLKRKGTLSDGNEYKKYTQYRLFELKSNDYDKSYTSLMNSNGYKKINYFNWFQDSDGIPRKKLIATSKINCYPRDSDGNLYNGDIDLSQIVQTIPRHKQKVESFGNKSIARINRENLVKCLIVENSTTAKPNILEWIKTLRFN